jgi:hypothetical protein
VKFFGTISLFILISGQSVFSQHYFQATYGVPGYNYGVVTRPAADSGYMVFGNRTAISGNGDIYCIRIDSIGQIIYDKTIDFGNLEVVTDVAYIKGSGYGIIGYTYVSTANTYDILLIRTDTACNVLWSKTIGGSGWDMGYSIKALPDTGFMICGETYNNTAGFNDGFICRTDKNGDTLWTKTIGGVGSDAFYALDSANNNNFYAVGYTKSGTPDLDAFYAKFTIDGDTLWTKRFGASDKDEKMLGTCTTVDNGLFMVGYLADTVQNAIHHYLILRMDSSGNYLWSENSNNAKNDEYKSIQQRADSTIVLAGYTENYGGGAKDIIYIGLNNNNAHIFGTTEGGLEDETSNDVMFTEDGGFVITGTTNGIGQFVTDIYVYKTNNAFFCNHTIYNYTAIEETDTRTFANALNLYPNPAGKMLTILTTGNHNFSADIKIYSIQGRLVYQNQEYFLGGRTNIDVSGLAPSAYIVSVESKDKMFLRSLFIKR